ncbi:MAG: bifunctional folylpolyglutamate synthase/dihydrofolate synthase, partial [Cytophagia bacterium]|nr:bifunctional folylpolyglutamate synthase/dihydrofolate synthase [Cytophagia bacterium]
MLPEHANLIFCEPKIPRALLIDELKAKTNHLKQGRDYVQDVNEAIALAKSKATAEDMIYIGGSTFVVAEIEGL